MYGNSDFGFGCFMWFVAILFATLVLALLWTGRKAYMTDTVIRSEHRIEPEIELYIRDNQVDTVYVYRELKGGQP